MTAHTRWITIVVALVLACTKRYADVSPPGGELICTLEARSGLIVHVKDQVTGQSILPTTFVKAVDGPYVDSVRVPANFRWDFIPLLRERPGTYTVIVERPGYVRFERRRVHVISDGCHVATVSLDVLLQKPR